MYIMPFPVSLVACVQVTKTVSPRIWFLSLLNSNVAFNCEIIRDCYEAFALYCFERYLIACLGGEENTIEFMERQSLSSSSIPLLEEAYAYGVVEHPFPLNCFLRDWHLGSDFYQAVKVGIVQYMILKLICALLAMVFEFFGVYGEGKFEWRYAYPYLAVVINFSQTWALYCLVQFYSVTKNKLAPIKPLAKFLTFKSIIFLTWWQGVAVAFLFSMGAFRGALAQELKTRIQDYIICIEMGVAAVVHFYVFPAVPYKRGERCARNVAVMTDYASLGSPLDPEEIQDSERSTRINLAHHNEREERLSFPQSVRDVVVGSGEIIVDDMKFTVSHVVEPVERGIAKINKTFHQISENVKWLEEQRKNSKDDSYLIPLNSRAKEFSEVDNDDLIRGSVSDSGLSNGKEQRHHTKATASRFIRSR
ncbi:protein LAZ1 homolog 1 isoform X6 [Camellia sinensis]|uniref:protein LAZ1 homolog 1 isoform X5 n=1 Tax=Camellia sinensis TaxID=4442 RepID=UPI0010367DC9|nr:protein LAZ1 homolog 1 isoform X5 [Camellia sinensis]XP_028092278.1 protein LAZ1 homolog 1 isoform X6 [Camellia sinensis]